MSEPIPACISIGGKVAADLVPELCKAISAERVALEWGDAHFEPQSAEHLLDACEEIDGVNVLWLCDEQANWGRFSDLEEFLVKHGIPFDLQADGKAESNAELIAFRPGSQPVRVITSVDGDPVVSAWSLAPVKAALEAAMDAGMQNDLSRCLAQVEVALGALRAALPPVVQPLSPFAIG